MKVRALILVDMDVEGSFKEVAAEQVKLEQVLEAFCSTNESVIGFSLDIKERRGTGMPDLSQMKLKNA